MDAKPVAIGTLSCDKQETLNKLLSTGITQCSAALSTSDATDVKHQIPTSAEVADTDTDMHTQLVQQLPNIDMGTPVHIEPCSQKAHLKLSPKAWDPVNVTDIDTSTDKTEKAQLNLVLPSPESEDESIGAELVHAIIVKHGPELSAKHGKVNTDKDHDGRAGTTKEDKIKHIIDNQPTLILKRLTSTEVKRTSKPPMKKVIKAKKAVGIYPNASTASKYKFKLSQYGIKCKYKRNYTYKCQVEAA